MRIAAAATAFPPHYASQQEIFEALTAVWQSPPRARRAEALHHNVRVDGRHLALPIDAYPGLDDFGKANDAWLTVAPGLGGQALLGALERAGLPRDALDVVVSTTVTGIAAPSLEARLVHRLGLRPDVRRVPLFGLGCVAGAAGIARAADLVRGEPDAVAALVAVELCSLTLQKRDLSVANLIASGLFGDGAAAVVVTGDAHPAAGPRIVATRSVLYPDSEGVMGWAVASGGFSVILTAEVPDLVHAHLRRDVDAFLGEHGLARRDIGSWVAHPGGPRVLEAMEETLELPADALALTWDSLRRVGNLSSASVLHVLERTLHEQRPAAGTPGLLLAMGPGFCAELVLLEW